MGAIAASSCCVVPLGLFSLGVSGAWIGNLAALAPYQAIFVVITLGFLGTGTTSSTANPRPSTPRIKPARAGARGEP